jgi:hypothetical protein
MIVAWNEKERFFPQKNRYVRFSHDVTMLKNNLTDVYYPNPNLCFKTMTYYN